MKFKLMFIFMFMMVLLPSVSAFEWCDWIPFWDCDDPIILTDHTVFNQSTNVCSGERFGFGIDIYPCLASDLDGRNIQQYVNFSYDGAVPRNATLVFIYEGEIDTGKIELLRNVTEDYTTVEDVEEWETITLYGLDYHENLGTPNGLCDYGSNNNTRMWRLTRLDGAQKVYCFTDFEVLNATTLEISGNVINQVETLRQRTVEKWVDVSHYITFLGNNLNNQGYSYYEVQQQRFNPNTLFETRWTYTPRNTYRNGKWNILAYQTELGLMNSIENDLYLFIDPWWNNSWSYKREISNLTGYFPTFNITYDANMQSDFDDLRFLNNNETIELNYSIRFASNSNWAFVTVHNAYEDSAIYMYYGNPSATAGHDTSATYFTPEAYWDLENSTGADRSGNGYDLSEGGTPLYATGLILEGAGLDGSSDYLYNNSISETADWSYALWVNSDTLTGTLQYAFSGTSSGGMIVGGTNGLADYYRHYTNGWSSPHLVSGVPPTTNNWTHLGVTWDGSNYRIYVNGDLRNTTSFPDSSIAKVELGRRQDAFWYMNGQIDETFIYNKALTSAQMDELYTMSDQTNTYVLGSEESASVLNVTLTSPPNNELNTNGSILFTCICEADSGCTSLNMTVDGVLVNFTTNTSAIQNLSLQYLNSSIPDKNNYEWYCTGGDLTQASNSSTQTFSVDTSFPTITIYAPNEVYDVLYEGLSIPLNFTPNDTNFDSKSFYYNNSFNATMSNKTSVSFGTGSKAYYFLNNSEGGSTGDVTFSYNFGGNYYTLTTSVLDNLATWSPVQSNPNCFGVSYTSPTISFDGNLGNYTCVLLPNGQEIVMNITGNKSFTWDYNRIYLSQYQNTTVAFSVDNRPITVYAKDIVGNEANDTANISAKSVIIDEGFPTSVVEGSTHDFYLTVDVNDSYEIDAVNLVYNGTLYSSSIAISGDRYNLTKSFIIPPVTGDSNITFFWSYELNDSTQINFTEHNVSVVNLNIDDCSTYNVTLFNISLVEERSQDTLVGNIYIDIDLYSEDRSSNIIEFSNNYTNSSSAVVCLENALETDVYSMDTLIQYQSTDFETELYNYYNFSLSNTTIPQIVTLYDLNSSVSTEFLITYKDESFLPVEKALINIQRKYVSEGVFKVVELPITDAYGQTVGHFDTQQGIYTIVVTRNGQAIATFSEITVVCQDALLGDCDLNLNELASDTDFGNWNEYNGVSFSTSFDPSTRTVTKQFATNDGSVKRITLTSYKADAYGTTLVCNDSLNSASGTLSCTVPNSFGNISIDSTTYVDSELVSRENYRVTADPADIYGDDGIIFAIILMLTLPFMFVSSGIGVIIGAIVGLLVAGLLNLYVAGSLMGTISSLTWLIIAGGIIAWKISQRE